MTLSEMRQVLAGHRLQLTKSLGQNFLHDQNQLRKIVAAAELAPGDKVLEIGPGLGPLTELLLQNASEVVAIEKDARLVRFLEERFPAAPTLGGSRTSFSATARARNTDGASVLRLIHADALEYLQSGQRDWREWKMVSNLPYSVASPVLVELGCNPHGPRRMVATLQLEVARRLAARPGDEDYGVLTLLLQLDYESSGFFKIPASCFFPEPEVDSACVCLARRPRALLDERGREVFVRLVKEAFSQRRKMMLKLLRRRWREPDLQEAFRRAGISPFSRAESVSREQFVQLAVCLGEGTDNG